MKPCYESKDIMSNAAIDDPGLNTATDHAIFRSIP